MIKMKPIPFIFSLIILIGCSPRQLAIDKAADALSGSTGGVFASDDIPEIIKEAAPFGLKLNEALLEQTPEHLGLLLSLASGYTQYAYAFVHFEADTIEDEDYLAAKSLKAQAKKLYLRGRGYAFRGMEVSHPGFEEQYRNEAESTLMILTEDDVPMMYWLGMSWMAAISISMTDMELLSEVKLAEGILRRAFELDPDYSDGALHDFFITFEGSFGEAMGGGPDKAREHYERVMELTGGKKAGPYVSLATAVTIANQDVEEFKRLLNLALAVDVDAYPEYRLENTLAQRKASWLLRHIDNYFLLDD